MIKVFLHGKLGETFGKSWSFDANSATQVIRAIYANVDGFPKYIIDRAKKGIFYKIFLDKAEIESKEQLDINIQNYKEMHFFPTAKGAESWWKGNQTNTSFLLGGIVTAGAGYYLSGSDNALIAGLGNILFEVGMAASIQGAIGMLTYEEEVPEVPDIPKEEIGSTSYIYSRPTNNVLHGAVVPLGYGILRIGSKTISSSVLNARRLEYNDVEIFSSDEDSDQVMIVENR